MKKNLLFITGEYFPTHSAVSNCVENVVSELENEFNVVVLCLTIDGETSTETYNNHIVIRLKASFLKNENIFMKVVRNFKRLFSRFSLENKIIKIFYNEFVNNESLQNIDVIIPAAMPYETIVAALRYKQIINDKCTVIPYIFDQFSENDNFNRIKIIKKIKYKYHLELEKEIAQSSNYLMMMNSIYDHYVKYFGSYLEKYISLEHPLLLKNINNFDNIEFFNDRKIQVSYVGGLYKNYVVPTYLLKVFEKVVQMNNEVCMNFFVFGNGAKEIDIYSRRYPENIINHGKKNKDEVEGIRRNSNILISISENKGIQMSSKIFEYMSAGKPIIHFYKVEKDINLKILKKYPNCLLVREDEKLLEDNKVAINDFVTRNSNMVLEFEQVSHIFKEALPSSTAEVIKQIIIDTKKVE